MPKKDKKSPKKGGKPSKNKKAKKKKPDDRHVTDELEESAQRIWLAGLGALSTGWEQGGKLFNSLVEKGRVAQAGLSKEARELEKRVEKRLKGLADKLGELTPKKAVKKRAAKKQAAPRKKAARKKAAPRKKAARKKATPRKKAPKKRAARKPPAKRKAAPRKKKAASG